LTTADLAALERDSWIDPATAEAFGLYRVSSPEGAQLVGRSDREDYSGVVFPTYWPCDERPKEYFLRRDHPPMEQRVDGRLKSRQKYLAPPGRGNRLLFGPGESVDSLTDPTRPIVLVEGLKKTLAAWRLSRHDHEVRFLVCGISGVWNWRGTIGKEPDATGARVDLKGVIPDFDRVTWAGRAVQVLFDSDATTNEKVAAARRALVAELRGRGASVTAQDLPGLDGLEKTGFDDLLAAWGPDKVRDWLATAQSTAPSADEAEVSRLAALSTLDYGKVRKVAADKLGVPVSFLDASVRGKQKERAAKDDGQGTTITFEEVVPAYEPVDGEDVADRLTRLFTRFAVLPDHGAVALTLWTFFTYCLDLFQIAPRLDLASPEKRCGKTTVLSLLRRIAFHAVLASGISRPAIFRVIAAHKPTLLIDEMDTFIEANEELRGLLNSGHTRDAANIIRCEGDDHEPKLFSTWAAMAFAHIGRIPDTLEDRSIRLPMRRKLPGERVASLRQTGPAARALYDELRTLMGQIVRWVEDHSQAIAAAQPSPVDGLSDRANDNWMPLLSIAEALGGTWPDQARTAAKTLSGQSMTDNESIKVELLADIHTLYTDDGVDRFASADLCNRLVLLEERPWGTWRRGKPLTPTNLARLLKPFDVSSRTIRFAGQGLVKGYLLEDFADAFDRYLLPPTPDSTLSKGNNDTTRAQSGDDPLFRKVTEGACYVSENGLNPAPRAECVAVTLQNPELELEEVIDVD
jgi:putative DNA primase/helicase